MPARMNGKTSKDFKNIMKNRIFNILIVALLVLTGSGAAAAQRKQASNMMTVSIYVAKELDNPDTDYDPNNPSNLVPVKRRVKTDAPLRNTLIALTKGLTRAEEKQRLASVMFG